MFAIIIAYVFTLHLYRPVLRKQLRSPKAEFISTQTELRTKDKVIVKRHNFDADKVAHLLSVRLPSDRSI